MNITEFLEARIAEDEAAAGKLAGVAHSAKTQVYTGEEWVTTPISTERILAECAAKRAIIKQHEEWPVLVERKPKFSEAGSDLQSMSYRVTQEIALMTEREYVKRFGEAPPTAPMIRILAAVYKDHPDYQEEWAL